MKGGDSSVSCVCVVVLDAPVQVRGLTVIYHKCSLTLLITGSYTACSDALNLPPCISEIVVDALYLTVARHQQQLLDTQAELSELLIPCPFRGRMSVLSPW
jgi:hypothetical protein